MALSDLALVNLTQAKNFLQIDTATSLRIDAEYVGMGDGEEAEFDLAHTPVEGSLKLYVNSILQVEGTNFTISAATITFLAGSIPAALAPITASYDYSITLTLVTISDEYVGQGDPIGTTIFYLNNIPVNGSLVLYVDDVLQVEDEDYTLEGLTITFVVAPPNKDVILASYDVSCGLNSQEAFDDELLENLINAATKKAEEYTGRAFVQRQITESHNGDGSKVLRLYRRPIVSVSSVSYKRIVRSTGDGSTVIFSLGYTPKSGSLTVYVDGVLQTVTTDYALSGQVVTFVSAPADDAELIFRFNVSLVLNSSFFEQLYIGRLTGSWLLNYEYVIVYTAGYGSTRALAQAAVPDALTAVLIAIANWWENRLGLSTQNISGIGSASYAGLGLPDASKELLNSLRTELC